MFVLFRGCRTIRSLGQGGGDGGAQSGATGTVNSVINNIFEENEI
jgi:hypothetical protein